VFTLFLSVALFGQVPPWLGIVGVPVAVAGAALALQGAHPPWTRHYAAPSAPVE